MSIGFKHLAMSAASLLWFAAVSFAQTSTLEGDVKGEDGAPMKGALVKIDRTDIKGHYQVKTDKKGHYLHAGLPLGTYNVSLEVDGKTRDNVNNVKTKLGDNTVIDFDLHKTAQKSAALSKAAESGTLTKEQARDMSPEQKAALEKAMKEREKELQKNKALNDAFNQGMTALQGKQYDAAVEAFVKASEMDPKQEVVWSHLAEAYSGAAATKTGADQQAMYEKSFEAYKKALELKPGDAALHNNFALALARSKKFPEAQEELSKAAQSDPANAGRYYYNLGAVLTNAGQTDPAGEAFKKAIDADPNYADAQYQYGIYLLSKAQTTPDGKVTPAPGTKEAFEKYLQLKPDGPYAESAKGLIASMSSEVSTTFENPNAPKKGKKK